MCSRAPESGLEKRSRSRFLAEDCPAVFSAAGLLTSSKCGSNDFNFVTGMAGGTGGSSDGSEMQPWLVQVLRIDLMAMSLFWPREYRHH